MRNSNFQIYYWLNFSINYLIADDLISGDILVFSVPIKINNKSRPSEMDCSFMPWTLSKIHKQFLKDRLIIS
jgi:hypothetical protein